ncbi:hypothetical protein I3843_12G095300 [Carya illinoinensis]|uniref:Uncharacterized protein n=1 Tax=Carya illinoinensis TaxID=32201 RepID=A0A8T1NPV8_CARIL|nr:hypothetical protein I3760_12G093300 [Carya illinoinensis]KAG6634106.1 hypothetical protein CIPAW_12G095900 [Carya illinoinensis]KAG7953155.1 hypothetical protein I3843_12G095300 [Carya illinoinensis]
MGIQHLRLPLLVFVVILAISQRSTCRHIRKNMVEKTKQTDIFNSSSRFSWHFSGRAPEGSDKDDIDPTYRVSFPAVPGGPNPLHN